MAEYTVVEMSYNGNTFRFKDKVSGYTTATGTLTDVQIGGTSVVSNGVANITTAAIINLLYPVGSYYETSDSSFSPSSAGWPGTWSLEANGQVHVSASTSDTLGTTNSACYIGYTPGGSAAGHSITLDEMPSHTHGEGGLSHQIGFRRYGTSSSGATEVVSASTGTSSAATTTSATRITIPGTVSQSEGIITMTLNNTHTHGSVGSGTAHTHTFTGKAAHISKMQPFIVINRWRRTA